jgi:hypothetical protein
MEHGKSHSLVPVFQPGTKDSAQEVHPHLRKKNMGGEEHPAHILFSVKPSTEPWVDTKKTTRLGLEPGEHRPIFVFR